jgi:hypothetical protein
LGGRIVFEVDVDDDDEATGVGFTVLVLLAAVVGREVSASI